MTRLTTIIAGAVLVLATFGQAGADAVRIESPATRATLLELYTSEGCSSCPPADRWLSKLKSHPRLWRDLVPVAFHVDYWNYLGWRDRFSDSRYSERQRTYARHGNLRTVYTPGFVVNGREWRGWFSRPDLESASAEPAGQLDAVVENGQLRVDYRPVSTTSEPHTLHIARLGFDLSTEVRRGENSGRRLQHDFVVLAHEMQPLSLNGERYELTGELPDITINVPRQALALWVTRGDNPRPLQAAGGWIE